jgi:hypothetical protein
MKQKREVKGVHCSQYQEQEQEGNAQNTDSFPSLMLL